MRRLILMVPAVAHDAVPLLVAPPPHTRTALLLENSKPLLLEAPPSADPPCMAPPNPNPTKDMAAPRVSCDGAMSPLGAGSSTAHHSPNDGVGNPPPMRPEIFIGEVSLRPYPSNTSPENKFADTFNNSTCCTLRYIPPERQNREIVVQRTIDMVHASSRKWEATTVGYFLGRKPPLHHVQAYSRSIWSSVRDVISTTNGFFFIMFKSSVAMDEVIDGGLWLFQGQPLVLQRWEPGMALRKHSHTQVSVWIKLRHLPVEFWMEDGLSTIASGIERPLYPDVITKVCTRLDFAHVCIMLEYNSTLPKHVVVMVPRDDGNEALCRVDVEYEWIPAKCVLCCSLGHSTAQCLTTKKSTKPSVKVYVQKPVDPVHMPNEPVPPHPQAHVAPLGKIPSTQNVYPRDEGKRFGSDKGKDIVIYNPFSVLSLCDDASCSDRGPYVRSPALAPT
ncbi:UNVERIFIED_CONTAM: hypothetical protein Sradi_3214500 [Sesamum radiatum]|uniref:DUF4283 domain-containing protein n=1 Tax=Sesamum radiatum TaxID=300843 RepID=A0AAW2RGL5_SESRA